MSSLRGTIAGLHPRRFFLDAWREIDREEVALRAAALDSPAADRRPVIAYVVGSLALVVMEYCGHRDAGAFGAFGFDEALRRTDALFGSSVYFAVRTSRWDELAGFAWWSAWRVFAFLIVPALCVKLVFRERLSEYGVKRTNLREYGWTIAIFYSAVALGIIVVASSPEFTRYYPFYRNAGRSVLDFVAWEVMYAAQFFALEFFFRGFLIGASRRAMGASAIAASAAPYCLIHIGKPFAEALLAVFAGIILGTLAARTRSIWSGVLVHVLVAVTMDVAAILATEELSI